jgi:hypothetical protein
MKSPVFPRIGRRVAVGLLCAVALGGPAAAGGGPGTPPERRILVIGDSQAQGLAGGFMRLYVRTPRMRVLDRSKIATGLTHATYDWPEAVKKLAATEHADVAVVMFGANDRPPVRLHGKIDDKLAAAFRKKYADKVTSVVTSLRAAHIPVIWVGHPQVRDAAYNEDMALLNGIFADAAVKAGADYVPLWTVFAGKDGGYDAYGRGVDGETERLRADDGVHMNRAGYDVLARYLEPKVEAPAAPQAAKSTPKVPVK